MHFVRFNYAYYLCWFLVFSSLTAKAAEPSTITVYGEKPLKKDNGGDSEFLGEVWEIDSNKDSSLSQLLGRSTSIATLTTGGESAAPIFLIRGFDPNESRYFLEGVPLTDAEFNQANVTALPLEILSRAEVFPEGIPAPLGEDGIGGAVVFRLKPWTARNAQNSFSGRIGSYNFMRVLARAAGPTIPVRITAAYTQSEENFPYLDDGGTPASFDDDKVLTRDHNQFRRVNAVAEVNALNVAHHSIKLFSVNSYTDLQIPGPVAIASSGTLKNFSDITAATYEGSSNGINWGGHVYLRADQDAFKLDRADVVLASITPATSETYAIGARGKSRFTVGPHYLELNTGARLDRYHYKAERSIDDLNRSRWQVPVAASGNIEVVNNVFWIRPAVQSHYFEYSPLTGTSNEAKRYVLASPRLACLAKWAPFFQLRSSVGSFYRVPTMRELGGSALGLLANEALVPEIAMKEEGGIDFEMKRPFDGIQAIRLSYTGSFSQAENLIAYVQNSPDTAQAVNLNRAQIFCHEFDLELQTPIEINFRTGVTLLDGENLTPNPIIRGNYLPDRPPVRLEGRLSYGEKAFNVSYFFTWLDATYTDLLNDVRRSAVAEHNVSVSLQTHRFGSFLLELRNLTDVITAPADLASYQIIDNTTGFGGYPSPGRRIYLTWKYEI